ncbi:MAG: hypothetical protein A4S09_14485 [Proteobacteria bacterium SG_bin7]|nr:MAG: hypothetical protein A4S09_14485 [Proteobacteria bacterium SG_bin7]
MKKAATFLGIGFELIVLVWFADAIGENLDKKFGWGGSGSAYGVLIAFVLWFIHMVIMAKGAMNDEED